jgi:hypothetical protein
MQMPADFWDRVADKVATRLVEHILLQGAQRQFKLNEQLNRHQNLQDGAGLAGLSAQRCNV